jgi:serine/threonine protein kinase
MQLAPGTRLGPYEITAFIGRGGMGEVWRARDARLDRDVAIKTLPPALAANADHLARFRREARAASALNHPNICTIYDLSEHDEQPFLVMELLSGTTLAARLAEGSLALEHAVDLGLQLADALDAAHGRGIIHRDIKPANIFVTDRGLAKILDFGLARMPTVVVDDALTQDAGFLTQAGAVAGTVAYMSPEQARGETLDARTDLFSLGVVLYEMTTGRPAFAGNTSAVTFNRILSGVFEPPTRVNPSLPKELDRLFESLLATDRARRCASARDLRAGLERFARTKSGSQPSVRPANDGDDDRRSIVVLPFQNLSADPDNEFFSDGLTDEIIADLSQLRTLRVISRNSSMQLKGVGKDLKAVASELGVRYVLTGGVRKSGNAVRITAQLVDPIRDESVWAEKYSGTLEDIFDIQEQISRRIVDALKMQLSPEEDRRLAERPIDNVEALECYQRSRAEVYKFTAEGLSQALTLINMALGLVGDNELLIAATGTVHWQYVNAAIDADRDHIVQAERCAERVFALNPDSAAGHALLAMVRQAQGRPAEAIRSFRRALAIDPANEYAIGELGRVYGCVGRDADAQAHLQRVLQADPLSVILQAARVWLGDLSGDDDFVQREGPRLLQSMQGSPMVRMHLIPFYAMRGRLDEARAVAAAAPPETVPTIAGRLCLFWKLALDDKREEAAACFGEHLRACARNVEFWARLVAECYAFIDDRAQAMDWLEQAARQGFVHYPYFSSRSRLWQRFDSDPQFQALMRNVKVSWEQLQQV